MPKHCGKINR